MYSSATEPQTPTTPTTTSSARNTFSQLSDRVAGRTSCLGMDVDLSTLVCARTSRVVIDMGVYRSILDNRKVHDVFGSIEQHSGMNDWYYIDNKDELIGPLAAVDMDERFQIKILNENTIVKAGVDDIGKPMSRYVKLYYRYALTSKLGDQSIRTRADTGIGKTRILSTSDSYDIDKEDYWRYRDLRVVSALPRLELHYLDNYILEDTDDDQSNQTHRQRAYTVSH